MAELPAWIAPGDAATRVWYSGRGEGADGSPLYQVAGPALDVPPASPYFLLAPVEAEDAAAFLWTVHAGPSVRVCFLIQNAAGVWICRLHPFEFLKEVS